MRGKSSCIFSIVLLFFGMFQNCEKQKTVPILWKQSGFRACSSSGLENFTMFTFQRPVVNCNPVCNPDCCKQKNLVPVEKKEVYVFIVQNEDVPMRLNPFRQADFLYFYSLQAGVVICSSIGIFLAITALTINLASENSEIENNIIVGQYILVSFYCVLSFLGFLLGLVSAYQERFSVIYVSISLQTLMLLYWLVLLILSFYNHPYFTRRVCIEYRCADHLWMQDARWRFYVNICDPEDRNLPIIYHSTAASSVDKYLNMWAEPDPSKYGPIMYSTQTANTTDGIADQISRTPNGTSDDEKIAGPRIFSEGFFQRNLTSQSDDVGILPGISEKVWKPQSDFGKGGLLAISIIFSVTLFAFFVYSITTLISYRNELKALEWSDDN